MHKRNFILFLVLLVLAYLFWQSVRLQELYLNSTFFVAEFAQGQHRFLGMLIFVGFSAVSAMASPMSTVPIVPVATLLWGPTTTLLLLVGGWLLGACAAYVIGAYAARPMLEWFISKETFDRYLHTVRKISSFGYILLFRLAFPAEIPGYVLGACRYHFGKYLLVTLISELLVGLVTVYASDAFIAKRRVEFFVIVTVGFILLSIFIMLFRGYHHKKHNHTTEPHSHL